MRGPVRVFALIDTFHRDALLDGAYVHAQIAADAFGIDHFEMTLAVLLFQNGLMRRVLTCDMT